MGKASGCNSPHAPQTLEGGREGGHGGMGARRGGRARAEAHGRTATRGAEPASALSYGQSLSRTRPLMSPRSRPCAGCSVSANWPQCQSSRGPPPASPRATPASPKIIKRAWHAAGRETASARAPPGTSPVVFKVGELGLRKGCAPHVDGTEGRRVAEPTPTPLPSHAPGIPD